MDNKGVKFSDINLHFPLDFPEEGVQRASDTIRVPGLRNGIKSEKSIRDRQVSPLEKSSPGDHASDNIDGGILADSARLGVHLVAPDNLQALSSHQPALGGNVAEEAAIFREMLKPFQDLPEEQRQKAVLLLIQDRMQEHFTYAYDWDTEGSREFASSPAHILADNGKGIDCEDYTYMAQFWAEIAQHEGMLPEEACFRNAYVNTKDMANGHLIFIYDYPGSDDIPAQRYVMDTNTTYATGDDRSHWTELTAAEFGTGVDNDDDLVTLREYLDKTDYLLQSSEGFDWDYSLTRPGSFMHGEKYMSQQWLSQINTEDSIAKSISRAEIVGIQQDYMGEHGTPSLPDNFNPDSYSDYTRALEIKRVLGHNETYYFWRGSTIDGHDLQITPGEARYLIGAHSKALGRELTISDMALSKEESTRLLGVYSPELKRPFTHDDLNLPPDTPVPEDGPQDIAPAVARLNEEEEGTASFTDVLQYKLGMNPEELTSPATLGADFGGAMVESLFVTGMAQKRLNKIRNRQNCIGRLKTIQKEWSSKSRKKEQFLDKNVSEYAFNDLIDLIFLLQDSEQVQVSAENNDDLSEQEIRNRAFHQLFSADKEYVSPERLQEICRVVINIFGDDQDKNGVISEDISRLKKVLEKKNSESWFYDKKEIREISKTLGHFGIDLQFSTDKFFGRFRSSSKPIFHQTKLNRDKLYRLLEKKQWLPENRVISDCLDKNKNDIDALIKLENYDDKKIKHYRRDRNLKLASAVVNVVPLIPVSDAVKSFAYSRASRYRKNNKKIADRRIEQSIEVVNSISSNLDRDEKKLLKSKLEGVKRLKDQHLTIKRNRDLANSSIHAVSAVASIPASLAGPVGSGVKSGVKATAKASASIAAAVDRAKKDKRLQKDDAYVTVMDIYDSYKKLYISAKSKGEEEKAESILKLVDTSFGIDESTFNALINSRLVENKRFKLSFSHGDSQ